jgi:hypothetical protein
LRLLTLWTKRDSGLLQGIINYRLRGTDTGGIENDVLPFDLIAQR